MFDTLLEFMIFESAWDGALFVITRLHPKLTQDLSIHITLNLPRSSLQVNDTAPLFSSLSNLPDYDG